MLNKTVRRVQGVSLASYIFIIKLDLVQMNINLFKLNTNIQK